MNTHLFSLDRGLAARGFALVLTCALIVQWAWLPALVRSGAQPGAAWLSDLAASITFSHAAGQAVAPAFVAPTFQSAKEPARFTLPLFLADSPRASPETSRVNQGASPSISKSASLATATFNDVFTYTVVFTIPAGTTITNAVLGDNLPDNSPNTEPNFTYVNLSSIGPTPGPGTPPIGTIAPAVTNGNHTLTWSIGTISNPSGAPYVYSFTYRVTVGTGDNRFEVGTNAAVLSYSGGSVNASTDVTVARAFLQASKAGYSAVDSSDTNNNVDFLRAGDVVTFTLFVTNTSAAGAVSTAHTVWVSDTLPIWMALGGPVGATPPPNGSALVSGRTQVGWLVTSLAPDAAITRVFTATVTSTVGAGRQDANDLLAEWRDLPGDPTPSSSADSVTMRSMSVSASKNEVDAFAPQGRVIANEPITYTLVVTIPAGTTVYTPARVVDTLNDGLNFGAEVSHSTLTLPAAVGLGSGNSTLITWTLTNAVVATGNVTMTFVFTASSDGTFAGGQINRGASLNNSVLMQWNNGAASVNSPSGSAVVTFVRPDIQPNKDSTPSPVISFGGEPIQYRITNVRNGSGTGDTTAALAYDVIVTDTLPAGFGFVEALPPPNGVFTVGSTVVLTWGVVPTLPVGYYLPGITTTPDTYYITATAPLTFSVGATFTNTVVTQYSDQSGAVPGEQTYFSTRTKVLGVSFAITKSVAPAGPVRLGDLITYTITDTVPAGAIMYWPRHQDDLPLGVRFVTGSMTLQGATFVSSPIPITVAQGTQERLLWWTDTINNLSGSGPLTVTATFNARVLGVNTLGQAVYSSTSDFRGAPSINNSARVDWNTQDISSTLNASANSNSVSNPIVQPFLADSPFAKRFGGSTSGSTTVGAGNVVTYHIVITNTGQGTAYDVAISDTLPAGLQFNSFAATGRAFGGAVFTPTFSATPSAGATGAIGWIVDAVNPGDGNTSPPSTVFTLTYTALVSNTVGAGATLPNQARLADYSSLPGSDPFERRYTFLLTRTQAITLNTPPAAIAKSVNVTGANWLDSITYTLVFPQPPVNASLYNVAVTDTIPTGITVAGVQATGGVQVGSSGQVVTASAASLAPLSQVVVTVTGTVDAGASGAKVNTATLQWDDAASGGARHTAVSNPVTTTILLPNVGLAKSALTTVAPSQVFAYTIVYSNAGTASAANVQIEDDLPNATQFVTYTASGALALIAQPDPLRWNVGSLAPGQGGSIVVTVSVPLTTSLGTVLTNTASITTTTPGEQNAANNTTTHVATVSGALLDIRKTANVSSVPPAGAIVYTLEYSNTGGSVATGVVVTDTYDPNVTFFAANPAPNLGNNVWNTPGTLAPGERRTIVITVTVANALPNGTLLTNLAQVSADSAVTQQSTNVVSVTSAPVLTIDKFGSSVTMPGYTLVYQLNYANGGNAPATSARLTETYPVELTFVAANPPPTSGNNVWDLGTLIPPASGTIVVTMTVGSSVALGTVFTNTVALGSVEAGPVVDSLSTRVGPIYLPLVMRNFVAAPNLVVQSIVVAPPSPNVNQSTTISVTIANIGAGVANPGFWLDLYVDPTGVPQPGQVWNDVAPVGKAWVLRVPLAPGQSITLDTTMPDDPSDPGATYSNWLGWFTSPGAHTLYAQVDVFSGPAGLVVELNEQDNLFGPSSVTVNP